MPAKKTTDTINWGILGPGAIARLFAQDLVHLPDARLAVVGSRSADRAAEFAARFGIGTVHDSYEALVADPAVDIVYVATPHPFHRAHALLCLEHGKPVLCEKPMAVNAGEVRAMAEVARARGLFLMEAMWSRFNPVLVEVRRWLARGQIGEVRMLTADFGFRTAWNPAGRLLNPALGGGALLDVGVYVVALASFVFGGPPDELQTYAAIGETGVDEQTGMLLRYSQGRLALLSCAVRTNTPQGARIDGTEGSIHIPQFWRATSASLRVHGQQPVEFNAEAGYHFEAAEAMACLRAGRRESEVMPLAESIAIASTLDRARAQIGLRYPME